MGRKRINRQDLPRRMYFDKGVYYFWPLGKPKHWFRDRDGRPLSLAAALAEYGQLVDAPVRVLTIADLIDQFERSAEFVALAERTQTDRRLHHAELRSVFGHYDVAELDTRSVLEWKQARAKLAPRQWNQKLVALRRLIAHAIDPLGLLTDAVNPCKGVKRMPEASRSRAPSEQEVAEFAAICSQKQRIYIAVKMLTGLRMGDLLRLDRRMILEACLRSPIGKSRPGKQRFKRFLFVDPATGESTGLREALDAALALPRKVGSTVIFPNDKGQPYTVSGWKAMWQYRMRIWGTKMQRERFHEHDIRATAGIAVEEAQGREAARKFLGHQTQRTTSIYTERGIEPKIVPLKTR